MVRCLWIMIIIGNEVHGFNMRLYNRELECNLMYRFSLCWMDLCMFMILCLNCFFYVQKIFVFCLVFVLFIILFVHEQVALSIIQKYKCLLSKNLEREIENHADPLLDLCTEYN